MKTTDPYARLDVPRDANSDTIRAAYRRLAGGARHKLPPQRRTEIGAAYELLVVPEFRARFDAELDIPVAVAAAVAIDGTLDLPTHAPNSQAMDAERARAAARTITLGNDLAAASRFRAAHLCFEHAFILKPNAELRQHCDQLGQTALAQDEALAALDEPDCAGWIKALLTIRFGTALDRDTLKERCRIAVRVHETVLAQAELDWQSFEGGFPAAALDLEELREQILAAADGEGALDDVARVATRVGPSGVHRKRRKRIPGRTGATSRGSRRKEIAIVTAIALLAVAGIALVVNSRGLDDEPRHLDGVERDQDPLVISPDEHEQLLDDTRTDHSRDE